MSSIWKYQLELTTRQNIQVPDGGRVLTAQLQGDTIYVWFKVDTLAKKKSRSIVIVGTGQSVPEFCDYIASVQHGQYVWHIFEGHQ